MRKLTVRERVLLVLLAVIAAVSGYVMLFYIPTTQSIETLQTQIQQERELLTQLDARLAEQQKMERELQQLSGQDTALPYMPEYDNLQAVMVELHGILDQTQEYSISFQADQTQEHIFCRCVTIPFTCANYGQAREILQQLHDSDLRGALENVQISRQENGTVSVQASMRFFEYQESGEIPQESGE